MVPPAPCPRSHLRGSYPGEGKHPAVVSQRVLLISSLFWTRIFPKTDVSSFSSREMGTFREKMLKTLSGPI